MARPWFLNDGLSPTIAKNVHGTVSHLKTAMLWSFIMILNIELRLQAIKLGKDGSFGSENGIFFLLTEASFHGLMTRFAPNFGFLFSISSRLRLSRIFPYIDRLVEPLLKRSDRSLSSSWSLLWFFSTLTKTMCCQRRKLISPDLIPSRTSPPSPPPQHYFF